MTGGISVGWKHESISGEVRTGIRIFDGLMNWMDEEVDRSDSIGG